MTKQTNFNPIGRNGYERDYDMISTQFGVDMYLKLIKSFMIGVPKNYYGEIIPPALDGLTRVSKWVWQVCQILGINYSEFAYYTGLISNKEVSLITNALDAKKFKSYFPLQFYYASEVSYDNRPYQKNLLTLF